MESFNLLLQIKSLIDEFSKIDTNNPNEVLKWFYNAIDYNTIFADQTMSKFILMTLRKSGYKDTNTKDNLKKYNELILSKKYTRDEIAKYIIGEAMSEINICGGISTSLSYIIRIFNERFNKDFTEEHMINNLNRYVGKNIIYITYDNYNFNLNTGVLNEASREHIVVNDKVISLKNIKEIQASDGTNLYNNIFMKKD